MYTIYFFKSMNKIKALEISKMPTFNRNLLLLWQIIMDQKVKYWEKEHGLDGLTAAELPECFPKVVFQPSQSPAAWSARSGSLQGRTRTEAGFYFIEYAFI